jgi:hypothetical protein
MLPPRAPQLLLLRPIGSAHSGTTRLPVVGKAMTRSSPRQVMPAAA